MGKDGRQALYEMVDYLKTLPAVAETEKSPIVRLIEEGDLVVAHLDLHFMGKDIRVIELFRAQDGKAAEHWDVTEEQTSETVPFIKQSLGIDVLNANKFLTELYKGLNIKIHRVITEQNFTVVHAEAKDGDRSMALFDIYQFEDNKLTGHWGAKQPVPDKMMHSNGMF